MPRRPGHAPRNGDPRAVGLWRRRRDAAPRRHRRGGGRERRGSGGAPAARRGSDVLEPGHPEPRRTGRGPSRETGDPRLDHAVFGLPQLRCPRGSRKLSGTGALCTGRRRGGGPAVRPPGHGGGFRRQGRGGAYLGEATVRRSRAGSGCRADARAAHQGRSRRRPHHDPHRCCHGSRVDVPWPRPVGTLG